MECEHGYLDRQRCALCRRAVESTHEDYEHHRPEPEWKRQLRIAERHGVPMPAYVRDQLTALRRPRAEQERLPW